MALSLEDQLRERLRKVEALYMGATSAGEWFLRPIRSSQ